MGCNSSHAQLDHPAGGPQAIEQLMMFLFSIRRAGTWAADLKGKAIVLFFQILLGCLINAHQDFCLQMNILAKLQQLYIALISDFLCNREQSLIICNI